jgi:hypothetical protein
MLYALVVGLTMFALPLGSIGLELHFGAADWLGLIGKWFVFWGVGVRLLIAGLRQYLQPGFTSRDIMGIDSPAAYLLVRELGGANLASGVVGLASLAMPSFVPPAALAAGIFYAVAGIEHVRSKHRGTNETIALVSDLFIAVVLLGFAAAALLRGLR